jgi:hypothetical protein
MKKKATGHYWLTVEKLNLVGCCFLLSLVLALLLVFLNVSWRVVIQSDFLSYYVGAKMVKEGNGKLLYDSSANYLAQEKVTGTSSLRNINTFRPLPFVAALSLPLIWFSYTLAFKVFSIINLFIVIAFGLVSAKIFKQMERYKPLLFLVPLLYLPTISTFQMGQVSLILAFLLLLIYKGFREKKELLVGIFSALLVTKTQYLVFAPFFFLLSDKKLKFAFGFTITFLLLLVISVSVSGIDSVLNYFQFISATENPDFGSWSGDFFTFHAFLINSPFSQVISSRVALILNTLAYLLTLFLFSKKHKKIGFDRAFIMATVFSIAFSIHVLRFDLAFLLVPIFILLNDILGSSKMIKNKVVIILLVLLPTVSYWIKAYLLSPILLLIGLYYLGLGKFEKRLD